MSTYLITAFDGRRESPVRKEAIAYGTAVAQFFNEIAKHLPTSINDVRNTEWMRLYKLKKGTRRVLLQAAWADEVTIVRESNPSIKKTSYDHSH